MYIVTLLSWRKYTSRSIFLGSSKFFFSNTTSHTENCWNFERFYDGHADIEMRNTKRAVFLSGCKARGNASEEKHKACNLLKAFSQKIDESWSRLEFQRGLLSFSSSLALFRSSRIPDWLFLTMAFKHPLKFTACRHLSSRRPPSARNTSTLLVPQRAIWSFISVKLEKDERNNN